MKIFIKEIMIKQKPNNESLYGSNTYIDLLYYYFYI